MTKILCVDDDELNLEIYEEVLSPDFNVKLMSSGEECLDMVDEFQPDLVLMDVVMPGMNGFECCRQIKQNADLQDVSVIFVSSKTDIDARLEGYLSGGDDYLAKPFNNDELLAKIEKNHQHRDKLVAARNEAKSAMDATLDMLTTMGETSAVIAFLQQTFSCRSYEQLARKIIQTHVEWGLDVAIEMRINEELTHFCTGDDQLAVEAAAFDYVRDKGRLVDYGSRTAVNYPRISILVRNMPLHDMEFYGRIKDYIAIIAQGADSKIIALMAAEKLAEQQRNLIHIMEKTEKTLVQLDSDYKEQQAMSQSIISHVGTRIEEAFLDLGLTNAQEEFLKSVIDEAEEHTSQLFKAGLDLDTKFGSIMEEIQQTLANTSIDTEQPVEDETVDETVSFF